VAWQNTSGSFYGLVEFLQVLPDLDDEPVEHKVMSIES